MSEESLRILFVCLDAFLRPTKAQVMCGLKVEAFK